MRALKLVSQLRCSLSEFSPSRDVLEDWSQYLQVLANLGGIEIRPGQIGDQVGGSLGILHVVTSNLLAAIRNAHAVL